MQSRSKLTWRCRRGTLELDLMLQRFLDRGYDDVTDAEKSAFERLLDLQDPEISRYLMGREEPVDADIAGIVRQIQRINPR